MPSRTHFHTSSMLARVVKVQPRSVLKQFIKNVPLAYRGLHAVRGYLHGSDTVRLHREITRVLNQRPNVFFVQVGSNDGLDGDPIRTLIMANASWSGIFVEPVKFVFDRLVQNYKGSERFVFENVAISAERGSRKFYYVGENAKAALSGELPSWYDQLGSFDRNHIVKHLNGRLEPYIVEEEVECISFAEMLAKNQVKKVDLVHIDTEGFDYEILKQIDFNKYWPAAILYEHQHLSAIDKSNATRLLKAAAYYLTEYGPDTLAINQRNKLFSRS